MSIHSFKIDLMVSIVFAILIALSFTYAHELWIERIGKGFIVLQGEPGKNSLPVSSKNFKSLVCINKEGNLLQPIVNREGYIIGECSLIALTIILEGSEHFLKHIHEYSEVVLKPVGFPLEILVLDDPFTKKQGEKVTIKVLFKGSPVKGAYIYVNGKLIGRTRGDGTTRIRVRNTKVNVISAIYKDSGRYYETFLSFEVRK